jgi:mannose-1-phosphate guanylyltransferase
MIHVAILAGGKGIRLWPLSSKATPKQLLSLPFEKPLIEQTLERARLLTTEDKIWIVTLSDQVAETRKILPNFDPTHILAEPVGRNTAAAVTLATLWIESRSDGLATILVLPADHFVPDHDRFISTVRQGAKCAARGESLVTFGLKVSGPRTEFGYIELEGTKGKGPGRKVRRFIEKPPLAKAKVYAKSPRFFWNSGMFVWRSDFFQREMAQHSPRIFRPLQKLSWPEVSAEELNVVYPTIPSISIDYALMEKSKNVEAIPSYFPWSDVGNWAAVYEAVARKKGENVVVGKGAVVDGRGNLVRSTDKPVVLMGVDDLVVVETPEATLVTTREKSRDLKVFLDAYEKKMRSR